MLIPKYWAQYKQRFESQITVDNVPNISKQATIKRYGWSDGSQAEALTHAKARVDEAHNRWLAGEDIIRRERREQYNENNGIPIREEIIFERFLPEPKPSSTQLIVTRNSYGAQVANVNNIAIIDVDAIDLFRRLYPNDYFIDDFMGMWPEKNKGIKRSDSTSAADTKSSSGSNSHKPSAIKFQVWGFVIVSILIASVIAWQSWSWLWLIAVMLIGTAFLWWQAHKKEQAQYLADKQKMDADLASLLPFMTDLLQKRVASHPNECFRLYETPAGFRIMATHNIVLPSDDVVAEWFEYFYADTNYARLCQSQQCFRARVTAKPWRMTEVIEQHTLDNNIPSKDFF